MVQFMTSSDHAQCHVTGNRKMHFNRNALYRTIPSAVLKKFKHGFWVTKKNKKNEDEKCASLTTLLGIIFLFFSFSQRACLYFEKKSCSFD